MRLAPVAALLAAAVPATAQPMDGPATDRQTDMGHRERTYMFNRIEVDYARAGGSGIVDWDAEGWIGGDRDRFWYKSEGERSGRRTGQAEFQALYSRNIWTFFDVQGGIRHDIEPDRRDYAVIGVQGLARYLLATELHAFIGFAGDVSIRYKQNFDLLLTNRLILQPRVETDFYLNDARDRGVASGFSQVETGVTLRYEFSRRVAPYVAAIYDRKLGGTARLARAAGDDPGGWTLRSGIRLWF